MENESGGAPVLEQPEGRALSFFQQATFSLGTIGVNLAPGAIFSYLTLYYTQLTDPNAPGETLVLVGTVTFGIVFMIGRIVDAIADPLVGYFSDKWQTRWGRRVPWIVIGSPFLALFSIMVWYNPTPYESWANAIWLALSLSGLWFFYTVVVAPYLSMLPEITPYRNERVVMGTYMAVGGVAAMLLLTIGNGVIFDAFPKGTHLGPIHLTDKYKVAAVIFSISAMVFFYLSILFVREKKVGEIKPVKFRFMEAARECSRNPGFWPYIITVTLLRLGIDLFVAAIPIMVFKLLDYPEEVGAYLLGVIFLGAAMVFPLVAYTANRFGKKKVMLLGLAGFIPVLAGIGFAYHFPFMGYLVKPLILPIAHGIGLENVILEPRVYTIVHCLVLFLFGLYPAAVAFVLPPPVYADIMDYDEKLTGYRREAMYNGMEGLITKTAAGLSIVFLTAFMAVFGDTKEEPWGILIAGPFCALCFLIGWLSFRKHPFEK